MSIFYDNVQRYEDGANALEEKKSLQHEMSNISKGIREQFKDIPASDITKMKDYLFYYGKDWTDDPFEPDEDAEKKCRLAQKVRPLRDAIMILREFGRLDLLKPFLEALDQDGIHIKIDSVGKVTNINGELSAMVNYQKQISYAADLYKDELKSKAVESEAATEKGYDMMSRAILSSRSGKKKSIDNSNERLQDAIADALLDQRTLADCVTYINENA